jgi:hypothetical protein
MAFICALDFVIAVLKASIKSAVLILENGAVP